MLLRALIALSLVASIARAAPAEIAPACAPGFAQIARAPFVDPKFDSLVQAVTNFNSKWFAVDLLQAVLERKGRKVLEADLLQALNKAEPAEPELLTSAVTFRGRIFPSSYYFRATHQTNGWGMVSKASPQAVGTRMPYLKLTANGWAAHEAGGSAEMLEALTEGRKTVTLYRGTNAVEADLWATMKQLQESAHNEPLSKADLDAIDVLISKPRKIGSDKYSVPKEFAEAWPPLKKSLKGKSRKEAAAAVMKIWTAGYPSIFTTPDKMGAIFFSARTPGAGRVLSFEVPVEALKKAKGTYLGIEHAYVEVAFGSAAGRKLLLDSFAGASEEALKH